MSSLKYKTGDKVWVDKESYLPADLSEVKFRNNA